MAQVNPIIIIVIHSHHFSFKLVDVGVNVDHISMFGGWPWLRKGQHQQSANETMFEQFYGLAA
jgi:hypothetical protein